MRRDLRPVTAPLNPRAIAKLKRTAAEQGISVRLLAEQTLTAFLAKPSPLMPVYALPDRQRLRVWIRRTIHERIQAYAARHGVTASTIVSSALVYSTRHAKKP